MSSSSSNSATFPETSPFELSRMILQPETPEILVAAFPEQPALISDLRQYYFVSTGIEHLRSELERHRVERVNLYRHMMRNEDFQQAIFPILTEFRSRQREPDRWTHVAETHVPIDSPILSPTSPPTDASPIEAPLSPTTDSPRTIPILESPELSINERSSSGSDSPNSFHTASEAGSAENPINVDNLPELISGSSRVDTPHPDHSILFRPHPNHPTIRPRSELANRNCGMCIRLGHDSTLCRWDPVERRFDYPITCEYCKQRGHVREDCSSLKRDLARYNPKFQFCIVCNEQGHNIDRCALLHHRQY